MAERKSGPVKPPVIDLTAREATDSPAPETAGTPAAAPKPKPPIRSAKPATDASAADKPAPAAAEKAATPPPLPPPRPAARLAMPWSAISIATVAGAILGAGITYLAANWIPLPDKSPVLDDPAPALAELAQRADFLETHLAEVEAGAKKTQISLDATLLQLDETRTALNKSIADAVATIPPPQTVDLTAIEQELQTLESRVAAIAAGASSADATGIADNLVTMQASLDVLSAKVTEFETRASAGDTTIATLKSEIAATQAAIAAQNQTLGGADIGPAVRLPLIVSGLEAAFANGRPYAAELTSLRALLPTIVVPEPVTAAADSGLLRPDALVERFDAAIPDILAGRAGTSTGDWGQDALEWAKALLALRPSEEMEGDTPEAIVSRLEAAVDRHDFIAATALLAQLPEPMRLAAGELGTAIAAHGAADQFITGLRAQALDSAAVTPN